MSAAASVPNPALQVHAPELGVLHSTCAGTVAVVRVLHAKLASDLATCPILNPTPHTQARAAAWLQQPDAPASNGGCGPAPTCLLMGCCGCLIAAHGPSIESLYVAAP